MSRQDLTRTRPTVFVFEWMIGGGLHHDANQAAAVSDDSDGTASPNAIDTPMAHEGLAMLQSVCSDFLSIGCNVCTMLDRRIYPSKLHGCQCDFVESATGMWDSLNKNAENADLILVIAPETGDRLVEILDYLSPLEHKLLNPGLHFTTIASDKTETCLRLKQNGIRVPRGWTVNPCPDSNHPPFHSQFVDPHLPNFPIVIKPNRGAGSEGNARLTDRDQLVQQFQQIASLANASTSSKSDLWRIESWVPGTAASISVIANSSSDPPTLLPPAYQHLENQVSHWLGAELIADPGLIDRASRLAQRVHDAMPETTGYFGIDLVLGATDADDTVIEINPRLTSSYAVIRDRLGFSIAASMIEAKSKSNSI